MNNPKNTNNLSLTDNELSALRHYLDNVIVGELDSFKTTSKEDDEWWDKDSSLSLAEKVGGVL
jgi:hypothetical protein|tara:strand:+ start:727 stop:915 length:189 start_codon:yes stop_codon:yes gene_type:complete